MQTPKKSSNLSQDEYNKYNSLLSDKTNHEKSLHTVTVKEQTLQKLLTELQNTKYNLLGKTDVTGVTLKGQVDRILDALVEPADDVKSIRSTLESDFSTLTNNLERSINNT